MQYQLEIGEHPALAVARQNAAILSREFLDWLPENLHIWNAFVQETIKIIGKGYKHYSSRTIIEFLRHHSAVAEADSMWKINDHNTPYLPRLFDACYPQHAGLFEYRATKKPRGE